MGHDPFAPLAPAGDRRGTPTGDPPSVGAPPAGAPESTAEPAGRELPAGFDRLTKAALIALAADRRVDVEGLSRTDILDALRAWRDRT